MKSSEKDKKIEDVDVSETVKVEEQESDVVNEKITEDNEKETAETKETKEEINKDTKTDTKKDKVEGKKNDSKKIVIAILISLFAIIVAVGLVLCLFKDEAVEEEKTDSEIIEYSSEYRMSGNSLEDFDLYFLQLENKAQNKIYSPLSIKYALAMLSEGSKGNTKGQIDAVIGDYTAKSYNNNQHMAFANALFIRNSFKNSINSDYVNLLSTKYNAEVVFDSFENANNLNKWVNNKTLNLIDNLFDDESVNEMNYAITNALAIDMEWNYLIQAASNPSASFMRYGVKYNHENYSAYVSVIEGENYSSVSFNNAALKAQAVEIGASINNYDIVNTLGEENIRATVGAEYKKWLQSDEGISTAEYFDVESDVDKFLDGYIKEINQNYKQVDISTDFSMYVDDNVKMFAKDLKEYDGTTLQYIGIMPKTGTLEEYIKNLNAEKVNTLIGNLKEIKAENFKEGVVTKITGYIPLFKFDYELNLMEDLQKLGITDVFDINKADLSGISSNEITYIGSAAHKANIEFSNEGIKAAAATEYGGMGAVGGGFEYLYDVPVEEIDMTFDNPYMFLIRDKASGEVWFTGTVYEPNINS